MQNILIIGGGIGGLTAAIALQRKGFEAEVFEAAPQLDAVGKGIWMPPNAMQVFERLGVGQAITEHGFTLNRVKVRDKEQGTLQDLDLAETREKHEHAITSIHRARLQQTLAEYVEPGTLHLGKRCTGFTEQTDGTVVAEFEDGSSEIGNILIGADGIHSVIRQKLFPNVELRYAGQTCYRGITDLTLKERINRTSQEVWGGNIRFGFSVISPNEVCWFAPMTAPAKSPKLSSPAKHLADLYASFPDPIPDIIRHTSDDEIIRTDLYDFAPLKSWSKGHVVLLGDAAHAMTPNLGQGGAQSVEDGFVLAVVLSKFRTDLRKVIEEYEQLRLAKVQKLVQTARMLGKVAHVEHRWLRKVRNWIFRHMPKSINRKQIHKMYTLNY